MGGAEPCGEPRVVLQRSTYAARCRRSAPEVIVIAVHFRCPAGLWFTGRLFGLESHTCLIFRTGH
jgi:hypothetical protein